MKKIILLVVVFSFVGLVSLSAAEQLRVRYAGSIYTDVAGVPLKQPAGVSIAGNLLLVSDSGGKRLLGFQFKDGAASPGSNFKLTNIYPLMAQKAGNGDYLVLDGNERQIVVLNAQGKLKGDFTLKGMPDDKRMVPRSFKIDESGSVIVLDIFSERVLICDSSGKYISHLQFPEGYRFISDVAVDSKGTLYLIDGIAGVIYRALKGATTFERWNDRLKEYMNFPVSLAADQNMRLFVLDKHGSGLGVIGANGEFLGQKLGMGWSDGQLHYPHQVSVNSDGNVFIADTANNRIQQFNVE